MDRGSLPIFGKKREPFHSALPNEVVYIAHSFGLSAFRLQCLGCEDFVRLLSAAFNINPHFVQPVDSTHLVEAQEIFILQYTLLICFPFDVQFSKKVCVCVSLCSGFSGGPSDDTKVLLSL